MNRPGENKPPVGLVPPLALIAVAVALGHGANGKHKPFGWREQSIQQFRDAGQRHHLYREAGEVYDSDSGLLHSAHKGANALIELELELVELGGIWIPEAA